ncbi:MAG: HEPN domain-containing protein [Lachnospiraceae bacterium]|nr:HEPN domain-containing protein [Lachnospiraceae bacterium]
MSASKRGLELSIVQVKGDLVLAGAAIKAAEKAEKHLSKAMKGQAAYHLQQAAEKLIKIQLYASGKKLDNAKLYKHSLKDLLKYAQSISVQIFLPAYINKNNEIITRWEAQGRYDLHLSVRMDTLKKCYQEISDWYDAMRRNGYN